MSDVTIQAKELLFSRPFEEKQITEMLSSLMHTYPNVLSIHTIGTSVRGTDIPAVVLGKPENNRSVTYVGGLDGSDWLSTSLLLRFIHDYCNFLQDGRRLYSVSLPYLHKNRTIYVIPRLNPDGAVISRQGPGNYLSGENLTRICPDGDYNAWCANGCGVLLRQAFTKSDSPQTPEISALKQYMQLCSPAMCLLLDSDPMHCPTPALSMVSHPIPRAKTVGRLLSRMASCPFTVDDTPDTLNEWFANVFNHPAFTFSLGTGRTENAFYHSYAALREVLFSCPLLI